MARRTHVVLEDDLDSSPAEHEVSFTFEGVSYEIDLNAEHYAELQESVAPWISHARRISGRRVTKRAGAPASAKESDGPSATEIREWAKDQGIEVSARGRVPANVRAQYEEAHS
ncbi:histone-like nucleoid-structuring protein Lsr2 [Raineyella fluvialis]|uniref:Lsr2 family protein n=1 Tax=Raineyella fluvialis TaxID=2662261 RepID=A0A5Q2FHV5_9ACTN|nr:Lsr2 family protein [Raineyella fluvialis]QGF23936.1 Lsr2 family protein [Raineyella fluvialis]